MNRQHLLAIAAIAAVGALAWDLLRPPPAATPGLPAAAATPAVERTAAPTRAAVARGPESMSQAANFLRPAAVTTVTASPLAREFGNAPAYKPIYDRLKGTAEGETPEGQYYLHRILRACATIADRRGGARSRPRNTEQSEERRGLIAASLPEGDPRRAQRLEAFEKISTDRCAGLAGLSVTEAELTQLLKNALAGGDPKARAFQVERDMWQERRTGSTPGRSGPTLSEAQVSELQGAFSSRDPEAIAIAGRVLANGFRDLTVRIGPDREVIENRALMNAALLLACEYGYACGENNSRVLQACAYQGHCGVASLPDYLFYYGASPYDAQLLDRYRTILRQAADTGDWSAIVIERGNRSPNHPSYSYPAPPFGR